jgi:radical SAM family uncharacterized protein/radical SAM-linked protein
MAEVLIEPWLPLVAKPSRYIDNEINAIHKLWQQVNFCLVYPDVYEVGVSHLGLKVLYSILNGLDGVMADRAYLPWTDLADIMRREGIPVFGLESRRELRDFDLVGITLQSELTYTNILELLDISGIPLRTQDRSDPEPIIMAGGPCATNPLPLAPFIDVFFLGEAEEAIIEIADVFLRYPLRQERLKQLSIIKGCYVPLFHKQFLEQGGKIELRRFAGFEDNTLNHTPQLQSWQLATHNRCVSEIMRGCSRGCRFCQAGYLYRPVRERSPRDIISQLNTEISQTGWEEAGLLSLSSSDYSCLNELLTGLLNTINTNKTHISLPSLRVDALDSVTVDLMKELGREGLTIAPEAGSQRLRNVINKNLTEEQILKGVQTALDFGWQKVKLYFMIGLPQETEEDIEEIIALLRKISALGKNRLQINVTLSPFVPKPFTPFQWCGMLDAKSLLSRCYQIKQAFFKHHNLKIRYHTIETSLLEAILARGDEKTGELLFHAWKGGARFDGWSECFDFSLWESAARDSGFDFDQNLENRDPQSPLPWDFIDTGVATEFLQQELSRADTSETTPDCRQVCTDCGVCGQDIGTSLSRSDANLQQQDMEQRQPIIRIPVAEQYRYRVFYSKTGLLRFISHLDWMRMLFRLVANSPLDVVFTQGFSPHPKISLCPPLSLGSESECEFFDVSLHRKVFDFIEFTKISKSIRQDFIVFRSERIDAKPPLPTGEVISALIPLEFLEQIKAKLELFTKQTEFSYTKTTETRSKTYDLRHIVQQIEWRNNELIIGKSLASPALYDILSNICGLEKAVLYSFRIKRTDWIF